MVSRQLNKAIEIATKDNKTIYVHTSNKSFAISDLYCTWNVDEKENLLVIHNTFLKDIIIIDVNQIAFVETKLKH